MLRIGEFSRLARVSVKALRHYDRIGLLEPARTDGTTGYRYYTGEQLPRLYSILALKDLGFSLEEVGVLLGEGSSLQRTRAMLEIRRDEALRSLEAEKERLTRVEAWLKQIDAGSESGAYPVVLKPVEPLRVASVRQRLPAYGAVSGLFEELGAYAQRSGVSPGAWLSIWHDPEYRESDVDAEAAFATDGPLPEDPRIRPRELAHVPQMACTVHRGSFATVGGAYAALLGWIEANGYRVDGPNRELYLGGFDAPDERITEVQFPVEKAE